MLPVPFCNSSPARRGHYQIEKRYQALRNILHLGRRLSSVPPSLPADNQSTSSASQRPTCATDCDRLGNSVAVVRADGRQGANLRRGSFSKRVFVTAELKAAQKTNTVLIFENVLNYEIKTNLNVVTAATIIPLCNIFTKFSILESCYRDRTSFIVYGLAYN